MTTKSPIDLVANWHTMFGVALPTKPTFDPKVCALRIALLAEEQQELMDAVHDDNRVEMLDALCDLQYVLSSAVLHLGMRDHFEIVPMTRSMRQLTHVANNKDIAALGLVLSIKIKYLSHNLDIVNFEAIKFGLMDIQSLLHGIIHAGGFGEVFDQAFMAVHLNNCEKVWSSDDLNDNPDKYSFTPCEWQPGFFIVKNEFGKVLKKHGHKKVDLSRFVQ